MGCRSCRKMRRSRYVAPQGENSVLSPPARKQAGLRAASPHPEPQLSAIGLQPWQKTVNMFMRSESLWTPLKGTPGLGVPGATEGIAGFCPPPPPPWVPLCLGSSRLTGRPSHLQGCPQRHADHCGPATLLPPAALPGHRERQRVRSATAGLSRAGGPGH